jgi:hypothetical protein
MKASAIMKKFVRFVILLSALSSPALAERLNFDHRLYPPLKTVFDQDRKDMIAFDNSNPKYVVDRIVTQGKSASDWTEALDIISRVVGRDMKTADDWYAEIRAKAQKACASQFTMIARGENSVTFSRRSTNCGKDKVQFALYRVVAGQRSLFLLNAINRSDISEQARQQWLALLESARLAN